ncbi:hypothetical protein J6590_021640 [Homalodisca vitripennis]|nr:hypothetical protein J6590_021640 [Homalodisca vitripennis]
MNYRHASDCPIEGNSNTYLFSTQHAGAWPGHNVVLCVRLHWAQIIQYGLTSIAKIVHILNTTCRGIAWTQCCVVCTASLGSNHSILLNFDRQNNAFTSLTTHPGKINLTNTAAGETENEITSRSPRPSSARLVKYLAYTRTMRKLCETLFHCCHGLFLIQDILPRCAGYSSAVEGVRNNYEGHSTPPSPPALLPQPSRLFGKHFLLPPFVVPTIVPLCFPGKKLDHHATYIVLTIVTLREGGAKTLFLFLLLRLKRRSDNKTTFRFGFNDLPQGHNDCYEKCSLLLEDGELPPADVESTINLDFEVFPVLGSTCMHGSLSQPLRCQFIKISLFPYRGCSELHPPSSANQEQWGPMHAFSSAVYAYLSVVYAYPSVVYAYLSVVYAYPSVVYAYLSVVYAYLSVVYAYLSVVYAYLSVVYTYLSVVYAYLSVVFAYLSVVYAYLSVVYAYLSVVYAYMSVVYAYLSVVYAYLSVVYAYLSVVYAYLSVVYAYLSVVYAYLSVVYAYLYGPAVCNTPAPIAIAIQPPGRVSRPLLNGMADQNRFVFSPRRPWTTPPQPSHACTIMHSHN